MSKRALSPQDQHDVAEITGQVEVLPRLEANEVGALLDDVRKDESSPSRHRLVENYLRLAFDEAREHSERGVDIGDLYQEATLAVMVAVHEFAMRDAPAAELGAFIRRVIADHLEAVIEDASIEHLSEEAFVRDAQLYETVEVGLRRKLGRDATTTEIASLLEWPPERVETMAGMLAAARALYDTDVALYLDDEEPVT